MDMLRIGHNQDNSKAYTRSTMKSNDRAHDLMAGLQKVFVNGGPSQQNADLFCELMDSIDLALRENGLTSKDLEGILQQNSFLETSDSILGYSRLRKYGYAGDFELLERIFNVQVSKSQSNWDRVAHSLPRALALRDRLQFFRNMVQSKLPRGGMLLNIGSGPARDLYTLYTDDEQCSVVSTCIEMEDKAVAYAKMLNENYLERINFVPMNVFRYETMQTYHLIWSAQLFDYLNDSVFVTLLQKCKKWLKPEGQLVICVFNKDHQKDRCFWELLGNWFCVYRSHDDLKQLAMDAGFRDKNIEVHEENGGFNLYLVLKQ